MPRLLHLVASPRSQRSASTEVAVHFIERWRARHPGTEVRTLDLWQCQLPEFGQEAMDAKYAGLSGTPLTPAQEQAWTILRELAACLHQADILVLSVPLWNFGIPYKLKHFIDLVSQKDILFSFDPQRGFAGLLRGKRALAVYARGLDYGAASFTPAGRFDLQKPYVEAWLRFVGVEDIHSVIVEKTIYGPDEDRQSRERAKAQAEALLDAMAPAP